MRMARINVYLPDQLAEEARAANLNVSSVTQEAIRRELSARQADGWLDRVAAIPAAGISHDDVIAALDAAREELGDRDG
jgi:post-segregation antitoxin (ccd killing protein)